MKKILILAANPKNTTRLRLDEEVREIEDGLNRSKHRGNFTIRSKFAVRLRDLRRTMLDYDPHFVHFCGHAEGNGVMVEDEVGKAVLVTPDALAGLFELFTKQVQGVLLNACYSELQATAINKHIQYVIGMCQGITDKAALEFAVGFYDALGAGKSIEEAFKFGCNAIQLYNIPEELTPILKFNKQVSNHFQHFLEEERATTPQEYSGNSFTKDPVLHNLPQPDYATFIGRESELEEIHNLLSPQHRSWVITIDGIGGIGKSTLALEIADSYRHNYLQFPSERRFDAIIWTTAKQTILTGEGIITRSQSLRTLSDISTTIAVTLQREDIIRAPIDKQDNLIRQALTQQRTLLIIDNLETVDDEQVLTFIREVPAPTKIIVTTRHRIDVAYPIRLMAMPENDSLQLIADTARLKGVQLSTDESHRLYQRTGGVPLAIVWSVAQMGFGYDVESVLTRLGQPTSDIAKFCFNVAVESVKGKPAYRLLLGLSLFVTDASREALGQVAGLSELDRDDGLVTLEKLSLINKFEGRFNLLPLTKGFMNAYFEGKPDIKESMKLAFIRYFQDFCRKFGGKQWRLYLNLDADVKNIQLALEWAYQLKMWKEIGDFVNNLVEFLDRRGLWNELVEYSEIAIEAGKQINDKRLIMKHKGFGLGWAKAIRFNEIDEALASIQETKKIAIELDDEHEYAICLRNEGLIARRSGEYDKAEELLQSSLKIWQRLEQQQRWEIRTINSMGSNERERGNLDEAFKCYNKALDKAEKIGDIEQTALSLQKVGDILWRKGDFEEACLNVREALKLFEQLNIVYDSAMSRLLLAKVEYSLGNAQEAKKEAYKACEVYSRLGRQDKLEQAEELIESIDGAPNDPSFYLEKFGIMIEAH